MDTANFTKNITSVRPYNQEDALKAAMRGGTVMGFGGLCIAAVQNTLSRHNHGWTGVFTKFGSKATLFGGMGLTYEFLRVASANLREKEDSWNHALGGFVAGSFVGLRAGTMSAVVGYASLTGAVLGIFDYCGGSFSGVLKDITMDEVERKEYIRANRRRPIDETIEELGEIRGIRAPGHEERRRERLSQKYGWKFTDARAESSE